MSNWIPCSERLPEENQMVLIFVPRRTSYHRGGVPSNRHVAQFRAAPVQFNNRVPYEWKGDGPMCWFDQEVTHWMALPEPPEEG